MKKLNNKNEVSLKKDTKKLSRILTVCLTVAFCFCFSITAYAAGDPLTVVNNLSTFIFGLIRAVGIINLGWGVVKVGLSFQTHAPSQRSKVFLTIEGGIVVTFTKEILDLIIG